MRRFPDVALTLAVSLILVGVFVGSAGVVRAQGDDTPHWSSSAPVPEGADPGSPPDTYAASPAAETEIAQTYNAFLRISGAVLKPRESTVDWYGAGGGGCLYASAGSTFATFNTPIYLPQGSTVKFLRMYYNDTNADKNSHAWFTVYDLYGQIVLEMGAASTGSSGNGYATTEEFTHTINYDSYSYVVNWRPNDLGSDMQVCGFRIYYHTAPGIVYLPLIMR